MHKRHLSKRGLKAPEIPVFLGPNHSESNKMTHPGEVKNPQVSVQETFREISARDFSASLFTS